MYLYLISVGNCGNRKSSQILIGDKTADIPNQSEFLCCPAHKSPNPNQTPQTGTLWHFFFPDFEQTDDDDDGDDDDDNYVCR